MKFRTARHVMIALLFASTPVLANAATHKSTARLHGSPVMRGDARYQEKMINGKRDRRFKVQVTRALPMQTMLVRVNGGSVAMVRSNMLGKAKLNLRTGGLGSADPLPSGFPSLRNGDVVTVGPMAGVCFEDDDNAVYQVEGRTLVSATEYKAEYKERQSNGTLLRKFEVEIEHGAPSTSFDITVNGSVVGSVTTDGLGHAHLEFDDSADDSGNHAPLPTDFPSLQPGDTVQIGSVSVTLASDDSDDDGDDNGGGGSGDDDDDDDSGDDD